MLFADPLGRFNDGSAFHCSAVDGDALKGAHVIRNSGEQPGQVPIRFGAVAQFSFCSL